MKYFIVALSLILLSGCGQVNWSKVDTSYDPSSSSRKADAYVNKPRTYYETESKPSSKVDTKPSSKKDCAGKGLNGQCESGCLNEESSTMCL